MNRAASVVWCCALLLALMPHRSLAEEAKPAAAKPDGAAMAAKPGADATMTAMGATTKPARARVKKPLGVGGDRTEARGVPPFPVLETVFPQGGKAGSEFEIEVTGTSLTDGDQRLVFFHPSITSTAVMLPPDHFHQSPHAALNRFRVRVGADVPPGRYEVCVANRLGMSYPRPFLIDRLHEYTIDVARSDPEPSTEPDLTGARPITIDSIVNDVCVESGENRYRFHATAGQRLVVQCAARAVDAQTQPVVRLFDAEGKRLLETADPVWIDPVFSFAAPRDGDYVLAVHDFLQRGGRPEFAYRLRVATGPWIAWMEAPAAQAGVEAKAVLYGWNLPGSTPAAGELAPTGQALERLEVAFRAPGALDAPAFETSLRPADVTLDTFAYRLHTAAGDSNPVRMALGDGPVVLESASNDRPEDAQLLPVPSCAVGRLEQPDDHDWYCFQARAGEKLRLEVFAQRLGAAIDPCLYVDKVGERDDQQIGAGAGNVGDPSYDFVAPSDGTYRLMVRNLYTSVKGDPRSVYLLSIRPQRADFRLLAFDANPLLYTDYGIAHPAILQTGGSAHVEVRAIRSGGFDGEIRLAAEGLPPGVVAAPTVIGPGIESAAVVLRVAPGAPEWDGEFTIVGSADIDGTATTRKACAVQRPMRLREKVLLSVRHRMSCPYEVDAGQGETWRVPRGGKVQIPLTVTRHDGFTGPVQLTPWGSLFPQKLVLSQPQVTDPHPRRIPYFVQEKNLPAAVWVDAGADATTFEVDATAAATPGRFSFILRGEADIGYARNPRDALRLRLSRGNECVGTAMTVHSPPILIEVVASPFTLTKMPEAVTTEVGGAAGESIVTLTREFGFDGEIHLDFKPGFDHGLRFAEGHDLVRGGASEAKLAVVAPAGTKPGDYPCVLRLNYRLGENDLSIERPLTVSVTAAKAKP